MRDTNGNLDVEYGHVTPYTWWLECIDNKLCKPDIGDLIILQWYPGMGKTNLSFFTAEQNVLAGNRVAYISLELTKKALIHRICRQTANIGYLERQNADYTQKQIDIMNDRLEYYKALSEEWLFWIIWANENPTEQSLKEIIHECNDKWFNMIIIDNLGKVGRCAVDWEAQASCTSMLQNLKDELKLLIILLHHLRKWGDSKGYEPWWQNAFSGSQKIKDNCTHMLEVRRDLDPEIEEMRKKLQVKLIQYKHTREGITGVADFYWDNGIYVKDL